VSTNEFREAPMGFIQGARPKGGSPMRDALREQLIAARGNLSRQLEILQSAATVTGKGGLVPPDNRGLIVDLQRQLSEINEAIANLGSSDG
jgi:hypothetical protein